jgi:hypothetical protein
LAWGGLAGDLAGKTLLIRIRHIMEHLCGCGQNRRLRRNSPADYLRFWVVASCLPRGCRRVRSQ